MTETLSTFASTILANKYLREGEKTWGDVAERVAQAVVGPYFPDLVDKVAGVIRNREFIPGGRYLANAGGSNFLNNCYMYRVGDSKEEIADFFRKGMVTGMTGGGVGAVWSDLRPRGAAVKSNNGTSTGPCAFMQSFNEVGRGVVNGGSRRMAIWAGLHWWHPDVFEFMNLKDWDEHVVAAKEEDYSAYGPMDMTNISVILDDEFFDLMTAPDNVDFTVTIEAPWGTVTRTKADAQKVYRTAVRKMLETGEPGFSVDLGENRYENLRNPCPVAGHTNVLTNFGYRPIKDIVGVPTTVWTGQNWAERVIFQETSASAKTVRVEMSGGRVIEAEPSHPFMVERWSGLGSRRKLVSVDRVKAGDLQVGDIIQVSLPEAEAPTYKAMDYTLGFLYGDGTFSSDGRAEVTLCDEKVDLLPFFAGYDSITKKDARGYTRLYFHSGFYGHRHESVEQHLLTPAFIAGLFDADGNFDKRNGTIRLSSIHEEFLHDVRRGLESLGILSNVSKNGVSKKWSDKQNYQLVIAADYRDRFIELIPTNRIEPTGGKGYRRSTVKVVSLTEGPTQPVYCANVKLDEHTFVAEGVVISNCEITSEDDSDVCCLGSINLARIKDIDRMAQVTELGTLFLLCGTLASKVPHEEVEVTRVKNRRLGLGVMGVYEWLVARGYKYEPNEELGEWLQVWEDESTWFARGYARELGISEPVKMRAVAPTGTIGIIAETTTGIEPLFALATKRRYLDHGTWKYQYVVDATAQRMIDTYGVDPDDLETAYDLAFDPARRLAMQAFVQQYTDHAISSTINLPRFEDQPFSAEEFGEILLGYLPSIRGITTYPDGARGGQPLNVVSYDEAKSFEGLEFEEFGSEAACVSGVCGI